MHGLVQKGRGHEHIARIDGDKVHAARDRKHLHPAVEEDLHLARLGGDHPRVMDAGITSSTTQPADAGAAEVFLKAGSQQREKVAVRVGLRHATLGGIRQLATAATQYKQRHG